ncbi:inorganic diphosphatase [Labrys wisconsinensis]|uniref:Inorganic pyrophosphatase n=1 Tax=Labrys wisconsinensis TaxID=425677 RepID=A0ABU0JNH3_9HYPH|nr:inorganic diphosphatase [Labrys wisconsinensis]MDQ0475051.1 inorganic pyrophosphatase [Labrys wisconsinensis]
MTRHFFAGAIAACAIALTTMSPAWAEGNILAFPQPDKAPDEINMVVEIPAGSMIKYETDTKTGFIFVDRFQSMPVAYPANYGSVTRTKADDGDPLDVIVYTREAVAPGALMKVRPIGVMKMIDGGEVDDKIVAVPTSKLDPTYDAIKEVSDLPAIEQERLTSFFRVYKQLPAGRKAVEVNGFETAEVAKGLIKDAMERYAK